jgi:phosphoglycolate phosphatase-like HAD superfamily hydrolase
MHIANGRSLTFSNVIWDVDGTLFDTYPAIARAFKAALNELERHGVRREETMAIGDRESDVLPGKAAGVFTCFFGPDDAGVDADLAIADFGELARLLMAPDR